MEEKKICCICGKQFSEWGNNPALIKDEGMCCDYCNWNVVVPARLIRLRILENKEKANEKK